VFPLLRRRLATGITTTGYPEVPETPPPAFRGMPVLDDSACQGDAACDTACPTSAIQVATDAEGWTWRLDRAACTGCGLCIDICPFAALSVSLDFELASRTRADLIETVHFRRPVDERTESRR
jgi:NADH-quinone oxidoreductase subunit I